MRVDRNGRQINQIRAGVRARAWTGNPVAGPAAPVLDLILVPVLLLLAHAHPAGADAGAASQLEESAIRAAVEHDPGASVRKIRGALKRLTRQAGEALADARMLEDKRKQFNQFFFRVAGFAGESDQTYGGGPGDGPASRSGHGAKGGSGYGSGEGLLLHRVLERRRGTCVGLAQTYLILAERLGLPVVAAATPTHLFARWLENGKHVNVELLEGGAEISDAGYRERHRIREADPSKPVFLRDLSPREVAARIYNNRGVVRSRAGDLEGARGDYERAIDLDPRFPAPRYNRALDLLNAGRAQEALADFDAALAIYPADAWALNNRGLARLRLGRSAEAVEDFEKALSVEADLSAARRNLDLVRRTLPQSMSAASQAVHPSQPSQLSEPPAAATTPVPDSAEATGPRP